MDLEEVDDENAAENSDHNEILDTATMYKIDQWLKNVANKFILIQCIQWYWWIKRSTS